jgi:hypothetical protein
MSISSLEGAISGLKGATALIQTLYDRSLAYDTYEKLFELESILLIARMDVLEAQTFQHWLIKSIAHLESEIATLKV